MHGRWRRWVRGFVGQKVCETYSDECRALGEQLSDRGVEWSVRHLYREYNKVADALANEAFDFPGENGPSPAWQRDIAAEGGRGAEDERVAAAVRPGGHRAAIIERRIGVIPEHPSETDVKAILRKWGQAPQAERKELLRILTLRTHPDKGGHAGAFRLVTDRKDAFMA